MLDIHRCPRCGNVLFLDPWDRIPCCWICGYYDWSSLKVVTSQQTIYFADDINGELKAILSVRNSPQRERALASLKLPIEKLAILS